MSNEVPAGPSENYGLDTTFGYTDEKWHEAVNAWLEWENERLGNILTQIAGHADPLTQPEIAALVSEALGIDEEELFHADAV